MSWKVLITTSAMAVVGQRALSELREAGCEIISPPCSAPLGRDDLLNLLPGNDAVLAGVEPYPADLLASPVAALDVYCTEPLPADHPFHCTPNLLLAPHQASFAFETGERISHTAAQAILDLMAGRRPRFVVNPEAFATGVRRSQIRD